MNLATARGLRRAKEVAMRKTLGAQRGQLIRQFLSEPLLLSIFAAITGLGIVALVLPTFNQLTEKEIAFFSVFEPNIASLFVCSVL